MKFRVPFTFLVTQMLILTLSLNAFAVCDKERRERDEFQGHFDTASRIAAAACAGGSFFTLFTFGLSLVPCAAAVATAENQKRILKEKESNLSRCETAHLESQTRAAEVAQARQKRILAIHQDFDRRREVLRQEFQAQMAFAQTEFDREGYDLANEAVRQELDETLRRLQGELDARLAELEEERARAVAAV